MRRSIFLFSVIWFSYAGGFLFAQSGFVQGEKLFLQNKPDEALGFLESAVSAPDAPLQAFLYLAMAYQQLNRLDEAAAVYQKILPDAGDAAALVAYSLGNVYYAQKNFPLAESSYTRAIEADDSFASAYLNRANTRLLVGAVEDAVSDYTQYLSLDAESAKRPQIEAILAAIQKAEDDKAAVSAEEARRKAEEDADALAKAQAEEQRAKNAIPAILTTLQTIEDIMAQIDAQAAPPPDSEKEESEKDIETEISSNQDEVLENTENTEENEEIEQ
jgi:tetratricopeptide (TPR) repeat protein